MKPSLREILNNILKNIVKDTNTLIAEEIISELDKGNKPKINDIAAKTFSNKSSVTRFAKSLGFEGFRQFVEILMIQEEKYYSLNEKIIEADTAFTILKNKHIEIINSIDKQFSIIKTIAKNINLQKKVNIFSSIQNTQIAHTFSQQLQILGINVKEVEYNQQQILSANIGKDEINIFVVSGMSNSVLAKIFTNLMQEHQTIYVLSTTSQLSKFKNATEIINIEVGHSIMREQLKSFCFKYIMDQVINILINLNNEYVNVLINPKYKY